MKLFKTFALLFVFLVAFAFPGKTFALSCIEPPKPEQAFVKYDSVFQAKAISVKKAAGKSSNGETHNLITFQVFKSWKGIPYEKISMTEDSGWGIVEEGQTYMVFANKLDKNDWEVPLCSPTKKVADAKDDLLFLSQKQLLDIKGEIKESSFSVLSFAPTLLLIIGGIILLYLAKRKRNNQA